jgi:hypothetical protein
MAQNRMKQQINQHHSEREFEVGDWVFLRLQPYKQMSLPGQRWVPPPLGSDIHIAFR